MENPAEKNAGRFAGFAPLYAQVRPALPVRAAELVTLYLGRQPGLVADMGCGTGLSTYVWAGRCREVVGIEPGAEMLAEARAKAVPGVSFVQAFAHDTGLPDACADAVVCSQSFHWMEPVSTLAEVGRLLVPGGVFAAVDCDWPPLCGVEAELAYARLFASVARAEAETPALRDASVKWPKENHLRSLRESGHFRFVREAVFDSEEACTADRLCGLAFSQGGFQAALKARPDIVGAQAERFCDTLRCLFGADTFPIRFGYRMRIGVK